MVDTKDAITTVVQVLHDGEMALRISVSISKILSKGLSL
jgi:hypothetical protein